MGNIYFLDPGPNLLWGFFFLWEGEWGLKSTLF